MKPSLEVDLGLVQQYPRWNGKTILDLDDDQIVQILRGLQRLAEHKRRSELWAIFEMLEERWVSMRPFLEQMKDETKAMSWHDFVEEPTFTEVYEESKRRMLDWDIGVNLDEEIDLSNRGPLERQIVGAIRDCVNAHGPVTRETANSAAKRVIGAIKTYNKKARKP